MKDSIELRENQTILFTGDSITDADRKKRAYKPFGYGYVHFTANYLLAKYPDLNLRIINTGISGHTVTDLSKRWQRDCLDHHPDIVSVLIGINDCWQAHASDRDSAVALEHYKSTYDRILAELTENTNCQLVLMQPFLFCNDPKEEFFTELGGYIDFVNSLTEKYNAVLITLQNAIDEKIKTVEPQKWSDDMVHPYLWAHSWISQRWIETTKL